MVILNWLHTMLIGERKEVSEASTGRGVEDLKKEDKARATDLINAALVDHAESLEDLISCGSSFIERKKMKRKVRKKVEKVISDEFSDPELIEEVTEKITDAAEVDPYYRNLFCRDDK